jgi:hypothetical protein
MLGEAFDKEVREFCQSSESMPELKASFQLLELYGRFIGRKYDIYQEEKCKIPVTNVGATERREADLNTLKEDHLLLAMKVLFTEEQVALFQNKGRCTLSNEQLTSIGIVQVSDDGKPHFIHRTFAEYYVADCLVNRLTGENNTSQQVLDFILKDVFQKEDYRVVRVFIDGLLSRSKLTEQVLKEYGNQIHGLLEEHQKDDIDEDGDKDSEDEYVNYDDDGLYDISCDSLILIHRAVREGNIKVIEFLLNSAQAAEDTDTVNRLLLVRDEKGRTAWHQTVFSHNIQVSEKLWECAKRNLSAHELRGEMLFAKDYRKMNAWHSAANKGKIELLLKQWELAKENLTTDEVYKLLSATDIDGRTVVHVAAKFDKMDVFQGILKLAKENLKTEEVNKFLLTTDNVGSRSFMRQHGLIN